MRQLTALIAAALSLAGPRALAHHAFAAEFDINKPITIEGTVTEWEMINPHSWFHINVENADGQKLRSGRYASGRARLLVAGWDKQGGWQRLDLSRRTTLVSWRLRARWRWRRPLIRDEYKKT
jgi:hypothetical protein